MSDIIEAFARVQDVVRRIIPQTQTTFRTVTNIAELEELHIVDSFVSEIAIKTTV